MMIDNKLTNKDINDSLKGFIAEKEYPEKRIDILLNSICGGGIFLIFQFIKESGVESLEKNQIIFLILSGCGFILAIIINFFAMQLKVNYIKIQEVYLSKLKILIEFPNLTQKQKKKVEPDVDEYIENIIKKGKLQGFLNITSTCLMILALALLMFFLINYLWNIN